MSSAFSNSTQSSTTRVRPRLLAVPPPLPSAAAASAASAAHAGMLTGHEPAFKTRHPNRGTKRSATAPSAVVDEPNKVPQFVFQTSMAKYMSEREHEPESKTPSNTPRFVFNTKMPAPTHDHDRNLGDLLLRHHRNRVSDSASMLHSDDSSEVYNDDVRSTLVSPAAVSSVSSVVSPATVPETRDVATAVSPVPVPAPAPAPAPESKALPVAASEPEPEPEPAAVPEPAGAVVSNNEVKAEPWVPQVPDAEQKPSGVTNFDRLRLAPLGFVAVKLCEVVWRAHQQQYRSLLPQYRSLEAAWKFVCAPDDPTILNTVMDMAAAASGPGPHGGTFARLRRDWYKMVAQTNRVKAHNGPTMRSRQLQIVQAARDFSIHLRFVNHHAERWPQLSVADYELLNQATLRSACFGAWASIPRVVEIGKPDTQQQSTLVDMSCLDELRAIANCIHMLELSSLRLQSRMQLQLRDIQPRISAVLTRATHSLACSDFIPRDVKSTYCDRMFVVFGTYDVLMTQFFASQFDHASIASLCRAFCRNAATCHSVIKALRAAVLESERDISDVEATLGLDRVHHALIAMVLSVMVCVSTSALRSPLPTNIHADTVEVPVPDGKDMLEPEAVSDLEYEAPANDAHEDAKDQDQDQDQDEDEDVKSQHEDEDEEMELGPGPGPDEEDAVTVSSHSGEDEDEDEEDAATVSSQSEDDEPEADAVEPPTGLDAHLEAELEAVAAAAVRRIEIHATKIVDFAGHEDDDDESVYTSDDEPPLDWDDEEDDDESVYTTETEDDAQSPPPPATTTAIATASSTAAATATVSTSGPAPTARRSIRIMPQPVRASDMFTLAKPTSSMTAEATALLNNRAVLSWLKHYWKDDFKTLVSRTPIAGEYWNDPTPLQLQADRQLEAGVLKESRRRGIDAALAEWGVESLHAVAVYQDDVHVAVKWSTPASPGKSDGGVLFHGITWNSLSDLLLSTEVHPMVYRFFLNELAMHRGRKVAANQRRSIASFFRPQRP